MRMANILVPMPLDRTQRAKFIIRAAALNMLLRRQFPTLCRNAPGALPRR